jgi:hypothetical protein
MTSKPRKPRPRGTCVECHRPNLRLTQRGLCWRCRDYARNWAAYGGEYRYENCHADTSDLPGHADRIELYASRVSNGLPIFTEPRKERE